MTFSSIPASFLISAGALALVCALILLLPWLRASSDRNESNGKFSAGNLWLVLFTLASVLGSFWFYTQNSSWNWRENGVPDNEAMAKLYELQRNVHEQPDMAEHWLTLGRFYSDFSQLEAASNALDKAVRLTNARDVEANLLLAEVLTQMGQEQDQLKVYELINASLRVAPTNRKALWYGGEVAAALGKYDVAIARWNVLLEESKNINTQEAASVTRLMTQRIASATALLNGATEEQSDENSAPEAVQVTVTLPSNAEGIDSNAPVFVFARVFGQPGPPLAVHRSSVAQLPLQVTLTDEQAMMPGRSLSQFDDIEIVARIALAGQPTAQSGDWTSRSHRLKPNASRAVSLVLDQRVP